MSNVFQKSSIAELDYTFDWSQWLTGTEVIADSEWTVPSGLTLESSTYEDRVTTAYISGGTGGQTYTIRNKITTDSTPPKVDQRSFQIYIAER